MIRRRCETPAIVRIRGGRHSVVQYIAGTAEVRFNSQRDFDLTDLVNLGNRDVLRAYLQCSRLFVENLDTPSTCHADCHEELRAAVEIVESISDIGDGLLSRESGAVVSLGDLLQQHPSGPAIAPFATSLFDAAGLCRVDTSLWHVRNRQISLEQMMRVCCLETIHSAVEEVISGGGMCPRKGVLVTSDQNQAVYFRLQPEEDGHDVALHGAAHQGRAILICDADAMEKSRHGADVLGTSLARE